MDVNEAIVQTWLETKGFLVRRRVRYDLSKGKWSSVSDVDLLAYNPKTGKRVAVLVTAWMTQTISLSHVKVDGAIGKKRKNFMSPEASTKLRAELNVSSDKDYERWWVLSPVSHEARAQIEGSSEIKVVEFGEVMRELVGWVRDDNLYLPHESEALQTIRALEWSKLLK